jgi:hypothetical protein
VPTGCKVFPAASFHAENAQLSPAKIFVVHESLSAAEQFPRGMCIATID